MKKKSRKKSKERQKQLVTVAIIIVLMGAIVTGLFMTGVIQIQEDDVLIFSTVEATTVVGTYHMAQGNCFAQAFVVPDGVTKISTVSLSGFEGTGVGLGYLGFSLTKSANVNQWAKMKSVSVLPKTKNVVISLNVYVPVYSGQVVYILFYWDFPTTYKYSTTSNLYQQGEFHYYYNGAWSMKSAQDARFRVRGYIQETVNSPPTTPLMTGDVSLELNQMGNWMAVSTDVDGDTIRYIWTVDGTTMRTSGYVSSGTSDSFSQSFSTMGTKTISVKAQDSKGASSGWTQKSVTVSEQTPSNYAVVLTVVDATTYALLDNAAIQMGSEMKYTDVQGTASFNLPKGTYTASVSKTGYESKTESITIISAPVSKTVYLTPVSTGPPQPDEMQVVIEVFDDETYLPLKNTYVTMGDESGMTDDKGKIAFSIGAGTYTVTASKSGYVLQTTTTTITSDKYISLYLKKSGEPIVPEPEGIPGFEAGMVLAAFGIVMIFHIWKRRRE